MKMRGRIGVLVAVAALIIGAAVMGAPPVSEAVTITGVTVTVGGTTWCDTTGACANKIWNLGGGVNLASTGNSLILTQTGGANGFNFDTSNGNLPSCNAGTPCATTITVNGVVIGGGNNVLANNNVDPGGNFHNEATDYTTYGATSAFSVFTGYADNIHADPCADASGNCQPDPLAASATDTFIGGGANGAGLGLPQGGANHCSTSVASTACFDAGVVRIIALVVPGVPEPSTLLLLGVGIMSLAAWGRGRRA